MNILYLVSYYPDAISKYKGIFFKDQVNALSLGHKTILAYPFVNYHKFSLIPEYSLSEEVINDNLKEIRIEISRSFPVYNQLNFFLVSQKLIVEICKKNHIEIIHGQCAYISSFLGFLISKRLNIPYCITIHSSNYKKLFRTRVHKFFGMIGLNNAHGLFAPSQTTAGYISKYFGKEGKILPNTINVNRFANKKKENNQLFNIGFLGRLTDNGKGLDTLIIASSRITSFDFVIHIGGDGQLIDDYKRLAANYGLTEKCIFYGALDPEETPNFFTKCDIFVLPSRSESFSIVVVEAMASGLPVIVSKCGGPEFLVNDETGIIIEKEDIEGLKNALVKVFDNYESYDPEIIREHANRWNYNSFLNNATTLYLDTISKFRLEK